MFISIKTRLIFVFGILTVLAMLVSAFSLKTISEANDRFSSYLSEHSVVVNTVIEVREAVNDRAIAARNLILVSSDEDKQIELAAVKAAHQHMTKTLASLQKLVEVDSYATDFDRQSGLKITEVEALYGPVALDIVAMTTEGRVSEAFEKLTKECRPLLSRLLTEVSACLEYSDASAKNEITSSQQSFERTRVTLITVTLLTLLSALVSSYLFITSLFRSLGAEPTELAEIVGRVASGDLRAVEGSKNVKPTGVFAGLMVMQEQLRDAHRDRERVEESKQLAAEIEQRKEAEARQHAEDSHSVS